MIVGSKTIQIPDLRGHKYELGLRWCARCCKWIQTTNKYCDVCGNKLRTRTKHNKNRRKYTVSYVRY